MACRRESLETWCMCAYVPNYRPEGPTPGRALSPGLHVLD
jgi:hypothetical protein